MSPPDFQAHNAEVKTVWEAYRARRPFRVPIVFGFNPRYTMFNHPANPRGVTFEQYFNDPEVMLTRIIEHHYWIRHHVPQDAEMGLPQDGWTVSVDFQNCYEAMWFGCRVTFSPGEVPDTEPLLKDDDRKRMLFDRGLPDPFGGAMARNWEFYDYFLKKKSDGTEYFGRPIASVLPAGTGTDGPMTVCCNLRGTTEFCTDLALDPDYARQLLDYVTQAAVGRIKAYRTRLGQPPKTETCTFADDSIQLISTSMYEGLVMPFHRQLIEALSERGPHAVHLCGDATRHFRTMRDRLNVMSFDTGFPVDFGRLRRTLGPEVEILGGPAVPFLLRATPGQVRTEVRRILMTGIMDGGRFVLREGNNVAPGTPIENLRTLYLAGKEFGRYPA